MRSKGSTAKVVFEMAAAVMDEAKTPMDHLLCAWSRRRGLAWSVRVDNAGSAPPRDPARRLASLTLIGVGETPEGLRPRILRMSIDVPTTGDDDPVATAETLLDMRPSRPERTPARPAEPFGDVISTVPAEWPVGRLLTSAAFVTSIDGARSACAWQANGGSWMMADCEGGATATIEHVHPAPDGMRLDVEIHHEAIADGGAAERIGYELAIHAPVITRCDDDDGLVLEASEGARLWRFDCPGPATPWTVHDVESIGRPA